MPTLKPSFNHGKIPTTILSTKQQSSALRSPSNLLSKVMNRASFYRSTTDKLVEANKIKAYRLKKIVTHSQVLMICPFSKIDYFSSSSTRFYVDELT